MYLIETMESGISACDVFSACEVLRKSIFLHKVTVKPAHVATSIKQSPVLKGHLFLVQS